MPELSVLQAIEVGVGLARTVAGCTLCQSRRLACPKHVAPQVLARLDREGYSVVVADDA